MENTKDPKISNTAEADIYFNSLIKSQSENNSVPSQSKFKPLSLIFLVVVIGAGLYFAVNFYISATNLNPTASVGPVEGQNSGAYFNPEYYANKERKITGRINKSFTNRTDERMNFELLAIDDKTIAYLYSDNNDLNLSIGLNVEIQGEFVGLTNDGKEIIEVQSIKLK